MLCQFLFCSDKESWDDLVLDHNLDPAPDPGREAGPEARKNITQASFTPFELVTNYQVTSPRMKSEKLLTNSVKLAMFFYQKNGALIGLEVLVT